jgi:transposase
MRSKKMTRRKRRNHSPEFKAKVAIAAIKGDKTLAEMAQQFDVHPNQMTDWKTQLLEPSSVVFGDTAAREKGPDILAMKAKIGDLALENDFLEGALIKAGLRSARRRPEESPPWRIFHQCAGASSIWSPSSTGTAGKSCPGGSSTRSL